MFIYKIEIVTYKTVHVKNDIFSHELIPFANLVKKIPDVE